MGSGGNSARWVCDACALLGRASPERIARRRCSLRVLSRAASAVFCGGGGGSVRSAG